MPFVSPFGERERALATIGITLGAFENKNFSEPLDHMELGFGLDPSDRPFR